MAPDDALQAFERNLGLRTEMRFTVISSALLPRHSQTGVCKAIVPEEELGLGGIQQLLYPSHPRETLG